MNISSSSSLPAAGELDSAAAKRATLFARLDASSQQRAADREERRARDIQTAAFNSQSSAGLQQQTAHFEHEFEQRHRECDALVAALEAQAADGGGAHNGDSVATPLSSLQSLLNASSHLLPLHSVSAHQSSIAQLEARVSAFKARASTKKKFAFSRKEKQSNNMAAARREADPAAVRAPVTDSVQSPMTTASPGFHHITGMTLMLSSDALRGRDIQLSHLTDCTVMLCSTTQAIRIDAVTRCKIYAGPTSGSVLIDRATECELVLAAQQLRIHHAQHCFFALYTRAPPIIEHCSTLTFSGQYRFRYPGIDEERQSVGLVESVTPNAAAARVEDFNWLRAQKSPNWRFATEDELSARETVSVEASQLRSDWQHTTGFT